MNRRRMVAGSRTTKNLKKLITQKETDGYRCQTCHKLYPTLTRLNQHRRNTHKVKLPRYQCSYCKRIYNNYECKLLHEKEKHPDKTKKVSVPAATQSLKILKCSHCPSTFTAELSKKMHELSMHSGKNSYACKLCPSSFNKKRSLEWHKFTLHMTKTTPRSDEAVSKPSKAKAAPVKKKVVKQSVKTQLVTARTPNGVEMVYANELCCDYCPTFFSTTSAKEKHEKRHLGDRPYTCEICTASFFRPDIKASHKTECRQLPFMSWCQFCDYRTFERVRLERHYIRNHGLKFQSKEELEFYRREVLKCAQTVETEPEPDPEPEPDLDPEPEAPAYVDVKTSNDDEVLSNFDDDPSSESEDEFQDAFQSPILESSSVYFEHAGAVNDEEMPQVLTENNDRSLHSGVSEINHKLHHESHQDANYMKQIDRLEEMFRDDHSDPLSTSTNSPESASPGKVTIVKVPMKIERPICQNEVLESNEELRDVLRDESSEQSAEECPEQRNEPHHNTDIKTEVKYSQILSESIEKEAPIDVKLIKYEVEVARLNCNLKEIFHNEEVNEKGARTSDPEVEQKVSSGCIDLTSEDVEVNSPIIVIDDDDD